MINRLVSLGLMSIAIAVSPAIAATPTFQSYSGDTIFPTQAVGCAGDVVNYNTRYQGRSYQGTLWIQSPSAQDCEGGRGRRVTGYFEERSLDRTQWCKGRLTLYLTLDPRGGSSVQWSNIQAVSGYRCSGVGTSPILPLVYVK